MGSKENQQIADLESQNVRLDILCEQLAEHFKQKGFKKVSFMVEPNCFAIVVKDINNKIMTFPVFGYSAVNSKKVKYKRDFAKANIDFIKLISNYRLTGFSLFLKRFPECEDVMIHALKLTNQSRYNKELSSLTLKKFSLDNLMRDNKLDESIIKQLMTKIKVIRENIEDVSSKIAEDDEEIEIYTKN